MYNPIRNTNVPRTVAPAPMQGPPVVYPLPALSLGQAELGSNCPWSDNPATVYDSKKMTRANKGGLANTVYVKRQDCKPGQQCMVELKALN
jgi:hypothetical protein